MLANEGVPHMVAGTCGLQADQRDQRDQREAQEPETSRFHSWAFSHGHGDVGASLVVRFALSCPILSYPVLFAGGHGPGPAWSEAGELSSLERTRIRGERDEGRGPGRRHDKGAATKQKIVRMGRGGEVVRWCAVLGRGPVLVSTLE